MQKNHVAIVFVLAHIPIRMMSNQLQSKAQII